MVKKHLLKASLFAVLALFSVVAAAPAASVAPVLVLDNPSCADLGLVTLGSKFEPVVDKTQGPITIDVHGDTFDFTSTVPVGTVIVKGGPNANVYTYTTVTFSDTGLHAPNNGPDMFYGLSHVEFCAPPPHPAIDVVKVAVASPIPAGGVAQFTIKVTNTGNVDLTSYTFTDPRCDGGNATQTGGDTDSTFGIGEVRTYSCSVATAATDTAAVVNTACASGNNGGTMVSDCDTATVTLTPPGGTTPGGTTPGGTTPGGTTPGGGTLPETIASGRARLSGPSGCVKRAFRARVTGRSIASVTFFVDGKLVKKFTGQRASYSIKVRPARFGFGRHRVVARVTFVSGSGTQARRLPLTFRRCAKGTVAPRFTG